MIKIHNLQKSYNGLKVLHNINLEISKGDIYGLVGISGAGKSTLLRCINKLETYESGSIEVGGVDLNKLSENKLKKFRRNIGMIFQSFSLLERKSVYENIALPMRCWNYNKDEINKKVNELAVLVELDSKLNSKPKELSGGQKQRVAIARALSMNPNILLCDEATSALDPNITNSILELLEKINRELGITIVIVTHQMDVVKQVCNKIAILSKGRIEEKGAVEDIFMKKPKALKELLGEAHFISLPNKGINIDIIDKLNSKNSTILSRLAIETGVEYSIVRGEVDKYRENILGLFTINIKEVDKEKVIRFLDENQIEWRLM